MNGGVTWSDVSSGLPGEGAPVLSLAIDPLTPTTLYAATSGGGVYKSLDGALVWSAFNAGLTDPYVRSLAIDPWTPTILYAGTRAGVFTIQQDPLQNQQDSLQNGPPVANAGPDQVVEADGPSGAPAALNGSASYDPEGEPLAFSWTWPTGSANGARTSGRFPIATSPVTLTVSDPHGARAADSVQITVRDTTVPTVAIISPGQGATVSGSITVTAIARDSVGVVTVQFLVDGVVIGEDATASGEGYDARWDTRTVLDGSHTLAAQARDRGGNTATSAPVTVTVANGTPTVPTL